ncbi:hypothetical protein HHI36_020164, partial [Cryptolaemus montrouzieri]
MAIIELQGENGDVIQENNKIVEEFNRYYSELGENYSNRIKVPDNFQEKDVYINGTLYLYPTNANETQKLIGKLKENSAP